MAQNITAEIAAKFPKVQIQTLSRDDIDQSLKSGFEDFKENRGDLIFIGALYVLVGMVAAAFSTQGEGLPVFFPLVAGLSILGPLVSAGFYEMARRREAGEKSIWVHFLDAFRGPNAANLLFVGMVLLGVYALWIVAALAIYSGFMGSAAGLSMGAFFTNILTTPQGWAMIIIGNLVGFCFAMAVLAISFVSLPMLVDKNVGAGTAMRASVKAFRQNRAVVLRWGLTVAVLLVLGSIPAFLGLAIVLPTLGYATWHLYTRTIVREDLPDAKLR